MFAGLNKGNSYPQPWQGSQIDPGLCCDPSLKAYLVLLGHSSVLLEAKGSMVVNREGEIFLDCLGGGGVFSLGHNHPEIVAAVGKQLKRNALSTQVFLDETRIELAEKLASVAPEGLQSSFYCSGRTEALLKAVKIARLLKKKPGLVCTKSSYYERVLNPLLMRQLSFIPHGQLEAARTSLGTLAAALIAEPVQSDTAEVPFYGYLAGLRRICDEQGILLILDESRSGLGRTGVMFACEIESVRPDIIILSPALSGGIVPLAAGLVKSELWQDLAEGSFTDTPDFGGNPLACSAALAVLDIIARDNLVEEVRDKGHYLLEHLRCMASVYPSVVKELRGQGLFFGLELKDQNLGGLVMARLLEQKVLAEYSLDNPHILRFLPPYTISREEMDYLIASLDYAIKYCEEITGS